eukprot:GHRR01028298.1.p1 GENE.GHRR01028298.1~~GHRR01028298.1.p1  ORF type:complete len:119 (+),score=31.91 GHRR01028298.1:513-869(+)
MGVPLPADEIEVLESNLNWDDIQVLNGVVAEILVLYMAYLVCCEREAHWHAVACCSSTGPDLASIAQILVDWRPTYVHAQARCCTCFMQWANMSMTVRGTQYKMLRVHFMPRCRGSSA